MNASDKGQAFRVLSLLDEEAVAVEGGRLEWIPLRRRLGIRAFGTNAYRAAGAGDLVIEDHVESSGQEEIYVVVKGGARFGVGDETVDVAEGEVLYLPDPDLRRTATATEDDTLVLGVGGWRDRAYHPLPWEPIFIAQPAMHAGDWAAAAEINEREAGEHREAAPLRYRLAYCLARAGQEDRALEELGEAVAANPDLLERAEGEKAFEALRGREGWPA
jgi:hypothetical protein